MQADVADIERMREVVTAAVDRFGAIHGVIHAAGVAGGGVINTKTNEQVRDVVRPKIQGTVALNEALKSLELDFFALCSSMSAIVGGLGLYEDCAANAFQDAFAVQHDGKSATRYIAINWDAWKEVGQAAEAKLPDYLRRQLDEHLQSAIATSEGVDAFFRVMHCPLPQWLIATNSPEAQLARMREPERDVERSELTAGPAQPRPDLTTTYAAPKSPVETALGIEQVGIDDNFFDLGGDSLLITRLHTAMRNKLPLETKELSLKALFEHASVASVAAWIVEQENTQQLSRRMAELRSTAVVSEEGDI
jgi:hypothetical protein